MAAESNISDVREHLSALADSGASIDKVVELLRNRRGADALLMALELQRLARIEVEAGDGLARAESDELLELAAKLHECAQRAKVMEARIYGERTPIPQVVESRGKITNLGTRIRSLRVVDSAEPGKASDFSPSGDKPGSAGSGSNR